VSDAIETTVAGATRVLFGTIAFICLMVGIEGMTGADKISVGLSVLLIIVGAICAYAAIFWGTAKKVLSQEAQGAIANFAGSAPTKAALLCAVLVAVILSPFVEQQRWPFSYPSDPKIYVDNDTLRNKINQQSGEIGTERELANRWRFSSGLRKGGLVCEYLLQWSAKDNSVAEFWRELFTATGWPGGSAPASTPIQQGITIREKDTTASTECGEAIQRELSELYPNPPAKIVRHQQTEFLEKSCTRDACIQIEVDY
jgi:hypothetical protein